MSERVKEKEGWIYRLRWPHSGAWDSELGCKLQRIVKTNMTTIWKCISSVYGKPDPLGLTFCCWGSNKAWYKRFFCVCVLCCSEWGERFHFWLCQVAVYRTNQEVTKRCRLSWLTNSALVQYMSPNARVERGGGCCGVLANEYSCAVHTEPK